MRTLSIASSVFAGLALLSACRSDAPAPASSAIPTVVCQDVADTAASAGPSGPPHTLTVSGYGVAVSPPDVVHMQFGVQSRSPDAAAALADNQAKLKRVRSAFTDLGVVERDVQVYSHTLVPQGETDPMTGAIRETTGFVADHMISVALRDPSRLDDALARLFAAGATSVQNIGFTLGDPQRLTVEARERAMADARARADQIARAAGVDLGAPLSIHEQGGAMAMFPDMYGMMSSPMMPTPGQLQQSINVSVTYRIP